MSAQKTKDALLHVPIRPNSARRLVSLLPRSKPLTWKFARNHCQSDTFGTSELCTWRVGPNCCRFQTRLPAFARKLAKRSNSQLVAWSVNAGFLRLFQERMSPRRARNLVERYLKAANSAFSDQEQAASAPETTGSIKTAGHVP
jgi:hypothetical protein